MTFFTLPHIIVNRVSIQAQNPKILKFVVTGLEPEAKLLAKIIIKHIIKNECL